jgi:micrococcal nuclease
MNIKKVLLIILITIFGLLGILTGDSFLSQDLDKSETFQVIEVIDGDTIKVKNLESGEIIKVRYLGIDTPELNGQNYETCFAIESREKNRELVLDKKLYLEFDIDRYDRFGRVLAYVYTEDEIFVNLKLVEEGFAKYYLDGFNTSHQDEFLEAVMNSQENYIGLWGICGEYEYGGKCVIKGNISDNGPDKYSKFYHLPEDKYYERTVVNLEKGDKWLCTIEEAEAKGFRKTSEE